jgi:hypothetical protein
MEVIEETRWVEVEFGMVLVAVELTETKEAENNVDKLK